MKKGEGYGNEDRQVTSRELFGKRRFIWKTKEKEHRR